MFMRNHYIIKGALLLISCMAFSWLHAQTAYTEHLTKTGNGKGKVVLLQDPEITDIVNNTRKKAAAETTPAPPAKTGHESSGTTKPDGKAAGHEEEATAANVRRQRVRATGFRIQIFTGSNSHADKVKAYNIGEKCRKAFPMLSVYPRYYNPRWTCRVGDFKTREEAQIYAQKIRAAHISGEVRIVKCEVLLQQPVE